jgi:hypothetical protein
MPRLPANIEFFKRPIHFPPERVQLFEWIPHCHSVHLLFFPVNFFRREVSHDCALVKVNVTRENQQHIH